MLSGSARSVHRRVGLLHPRAELDEHARHRPQRRLRRCGRNGDRVLVTWADPSVVHHLWIIGAIAAGFLVGVPLSKVPMTAVPQRTALSHAFGGLAAALVGTAEYYLQWARAPEHLTTFRMAALIAEVLLGFLTFTGSLMAVGKLQEVQWIPQRPVTYPMQNVINLLLFGIALALAGALAMYPTATWAPWSSRSSPCCRCCSASC